MEKKNYERHFPGKWWPFERLNGHWRHLLMCTACTCTGYFFSLEVLKVSKVSFFSRFHDQKVSRHWLIFTPFGAIGHLFTSHEVIHYSCWNNPNKIRQKVFYEMKKITSDMDKNFENVENHKRLAKN